MAYISPYNYYETSSILTEYNIVAVHDNRGHGEDSLAIKAPFSSSVRVIDSTLSGSPKAGFQTFISGKVNTEGSPSVSVEKYQDSLTIAVVDGATSSLIDGKDPSVLDENGNPVEIDQKLSKATNVAHFSQTLSKSFVDTSSKNPSLDSIEIYKMTIKGITAGEPYASANVPHDITPSATLSTLKETNDGETLEAVVIGDQTVIIAYDDGSYDLITADKGIKALESERKKVIKEQYPEYGEMPSKEQKRIRMKVMKEVMRPFNGEKYYVPFPDTKDTIDKFLEVEQKFERDDRRTLTRYGENSDIVRVQAKKRRVTSVIMSTDGFIERGIKYGIATPEDFIASDGNALKRIKDDIKLHEDDNRISHDDMTLVKVDMKSKLKEQEREQEKPKKEFKTTYACGSENQPQDRERRSRIITTPQRRELPSR